MQWRDAESPTCADLGNKRRVRLLLKVDAVKFLFLPNHDSPNEEVAIAAHVQKDVFLTFFNFLAVGKVPGDDGVKPCPSKGKPLPLSTAVQDKEWCSILVHHQRDVLCYTALSSSFSNIAVQRSLKRRYELWRCWV